MDGFRLNLVLKIIWPGKLSIINIYFKENRLHSVNLQFYITINKCINIH